MRCVSFLTGPSRAHPDTAAHAADWPWAAFAQVDDGPLAAIALAKSEERAMLFANAAGVEMTLAVTEPAPEAADALDG